jgi:hypothetical protein
MSINLKNAEFSKIDDEKPRSKEYDIYTRTIMEAKHKSETEEMLKKKIAVLE